MSITFKKTILAGLFLSIYGLLFYFQYTGQLRLDFSSFYSAALAYKENLDPYKCFTNSFFSTLKKLPANLNPPFFLQLISPLTELNFQMASSLWFLFSLFSGSIGALLCFKLTCSNELFKKHWLVLLFIYLGMFSTLMNTTIGQMGGILLFFIMAGYACYLRNQDYLAGGFWGIIIAIKLFPALLLIFALAQKRYRVFLVTSLTSVLAFFLPFLFHSGSIYSIYWNMLPRVLWFGDNWNASFYGFLFRLFIDVKSPHNLPFIQISYLFFFISVLIWYSKKISQMRTSLTDHRAFCLTLVLMLLMSPLGWLYYFSLLIMPLTIIWQTLFQEQRASYAEKTLWIICIFIINFPMGYVEVAAMHLALYKLIFYSLYFYGLVLIVYLLSWLPEPSRIIRISPQETTEAIYPLIITLTLGLFITISIIFIHGFNTFGMELPRVR
jgi:hypothetical protein